jgi:aryl-alcohol dehydrogenase-like predicted oxidoreductase
MTDQQWTRREFLHASAGATAGLALAPMVLARAPVDSGVEYRTLGKTGMRVSVLGYGGTGIRGDRADQDRANTLLRSALDHGLNAIDTAPCYGDSEDKIGRAIADRRDEFYIFSKVGHPQGWGGGHRWDAEGIVSTIERSLQRMNIDHLDVAQLHSCDLATLKRGDAIEGLQRAKEQGKTRFIGYSGDSEAARYAVETGAFDTLMTSINVFDQEAIELTLPLCRERNMGVIVKRPIGNAVFRFDQTPDSRYYHEYYRRMNALRYDFTSPEGRADTGSNGAAGVCLRFTAGFPGVHTLVAGTSRPGRWESNNALLQAGPLPAEQLEAIRTRWREVALPSWVGQQ